MPAQKRTIFPSSPASPGVSKRPRISLEDFFADESKEVVWLNIEREVEADASRNEEESIHETWIEGNVQVVFFSRQDVKQFKLRSPDKDVLTVTISCPEFALFKVVIGARVKLSLRGARLVKTPKVAGASKHLPYSLVFSGGAAMSIVNDPQKQKVADIVDVWESKCCAFICNYLHC